MGVRVSCSLYFPYPCGLRDMDLCIVLSNARKQLPVASQIFHRPCMFRNHNARLHGIEIFAHKKQHTSAERKMGTGGLLYRGFGRPGGNHVLSMQYE